MADCVSCNTEQRPAWTVPLPSLDLLRAHRLWLRLHALSVYGSRGKCLAGLFEESAATRGDDVIALDGFDVRS